VPRLPLLPLTLDGHRLGLRLGPPSVGGHTESLLGEVGYGPREIESLRMDGVLGECQGNSRTDMHRD
jgi:hypothetical protein